ncbi:MAG TPA: divergent PAP2 family protein [Rhizomicrobium sp.]|nr:divergent PAP2 family protein [Rhizomicrobium sp.]
MIVYAIAPFAGYVTAGAIKFLVNSLRARRLAFDKIGLGGLPSTHTAIVTTVAALIGFRDGLAQPAFAVAMALLCIVVIDAMDLRRKVGRHATLLKIALPSHPDAQRLRERMGHSLVEVAAGLVTGLLCGLALAHYD